MDPEPLVRAVVAAMMLLEESADDEIDPDTAVRGMENIAYELMKIPESSRREFLDLLNRTADSESDSHAAEFIRKIPFAIGMVDD